MKRKIRFWLLGVAGCLILAAGLFALSDGALGKPPEGKGGDKGGGGGGGGGDPTFVSLCVTFGDLDGDRIGSDWFDAEGNAVPYCDQVDNVKASTGDGFRLDTNGGSQKLEGRNVVRHLFFDFTDQLDGGEPPRWPPDDDVFGLASIDMRIHNEVILVDGSWVSTGQRLNPLDMEPGETARADLSIKFGFQNDTSEQWMVSFGDPPGSGTCPAAAPVTVIAGDDETGDGVPDSWWIGAFATPEEPDGDVACLRKVPRNETPILIGHFVMPFGMTLVAQQ
jgi:hypothetical protein